MMAEFAHYYGGLPQPDDPWPLVLDAIGKTPRFEARRQLASFDSVRHAISASFGGNGSADHAGQMRQTMVRAAYPVRAVGGDDDWVNLAAQGAEDTEGDTDGES